jgi:hypothetical protein
MAIKPRVLPPGTRVRLLSSSHAVRLRSNTGTVQRPDEDADYYVIRLDAPAIYLHADGSESDLAEIVEDVDNLAILGV